jgi:phosphohistidine phosphatase SixA
MNIRLTPVALFLITCSSPPPPPNTLAPDPPGYQKATAVTGGTKVSWRTAASTDDDWDLTLVARYPGTAATDGKPPAKVPTRGEAFGSGLVVYIGADTAFTDSELPPDCTVFTYQLWSHDKAGHWSGAGVTATTLPGGLASPAAPPSSFTVMRVDTAAVLTWSPAAGAISTRVVRNLGTPPLAPEQGTLVYEGPLATAQEPVSALPEGQTIFYAAFACNSCGACSSVAASTTLLLARADAGIPDAGPDDPDGGSPLQPTGMQAALSSDGKSVNLSWSNPPTSTGFTQVKVLRQLNALPLGPDDAAATTLFTGLNTAAAETVDHLLPDTTGSARTYFYVAYGCSGATCERHGTRASFQLTVSQALHAGGYTVWWRHSTASTCGDLTNLGACSCTAGVCTNCPANNWWKSCDSNCVSATARQLTPPQSTIETSTIHDQFAMKGISVSRVLSSEYCRALQTAQGMNFGPTIEQVQELTYFVYDEANRCANTYALLNQQPAAGTNTAMVSHAGFSCPTIDSLAWGEAAIFKAYGGTSCTASRSCPTGNECAASEACHPVSRTCQPASCVPIFITRVPYNSWGTLP